MPRCKLVEAMVEAVRNVRAGGWAIAMAWGWRLSILIGDCCNIRNLGGVLFGKRDPWRRYLPRKWARGYCMQSCVCRSLLRMSIMWICVFLDTGVLELARAS